KTGGLGADDVEVRRLVELPVVPVVQLQQFALADGVGRGGNLAADLRQVQRRAQVVRVGNQVVAQHHGRLVAAEAVDGSAAAAEVGLVEDVVVDQRGHVDHLDDGGDDAVGLG